ncbi:MAG: hypothetical protein ACI88C_003289, partial [Acidimicrobiales bacterium]
WEHPGSIGGLDLGFAITPLLGVDSHDETMPMRSTDPQLEQCQFSVVLGQDCTLSPCALCFVAAEECADLLA